MTRREVNIAANAILDVLPDEGAPEGHIVAAVEAGGIERARDTVALLVSVGLLAREPGPRLVPGPKWAVAKAGLEAHRAGAAQ